MALDPVPWVIGGEAEHGPEVARQLANLATNNKEGVGGPTDLKVVPLDVPGAGVTVLAGIASVLNAVGYRETYIARNREADSDSVRFAATGSSGPRADLVVLVVDNPNVDGNAQDPADLVHGPYNRFDVLQGVPAGTTRVQDVPGQEGTSAIALARVDFPASTGTVTSAMITDLRQLANPRTETVYYPGVMPSPVDAITLNADGAWFPSTGIQGVVVPPWATHASMKVDTTMLLRSDNVQGFATGILGDNAADSTWATQRVDGPALGGNNQLVPLSLASSGYWPVPARYRGLTKSVRTRLRGSGQVGTVLNSFYILTVTWTERVQ